MPNETISFYRYESSSDGTPLLERFIAIRETKCGWWIVPSYMVYCLENADIYQKFVLKTGRKRYAYPTKEEAYNSYKIRKQWRVIHLRRQLDRAEQDLKYVKENPDVPQ